MKTEEKIVIPLEILLLNDLLGMNAIDDDLYRMALTKVTSLSSVDDRQSA